MTASSLLANIFKVFNEVTIPFILVLILCFCGIRLAQYFRPGNKSLKKKKTLQAETMRSFSFFITIFAFWITMNMIMDTANLASSRYSQRATIVCPDYMLVRGGCVEEQSQNTSSGQRTNTNTTPTQARNTDTKKEGGFIDSIARFVDGTIDAMTGTIKKWVSPPPPKPTIMEVVSAAMDIGVNTNTPTENGYAPVSILGMDLGPGKNITGTVTDNSLNISFDTPTGPTAVTAETREESNSMTISVTQDGKTVTMDVVTVVTETGVTIKGTGIDQNGKVTTMTVEVVTDEDGNMSLLSVDEETGKLSLLGTAPPKDVTLKTPDLVLEVDAYPDDGFLNDFLDSAGNTVTTALDNFAGFLGITTSDTKTSSTDVKSNENTVSTETTVSESPSAPAENASEGSTPNDTTTDTGKVDADNKTDTTGTTNGDVSTDKATTDGDRGDGNDGGGAGNDGGGDGGSGPQ